MKMRTFVSLFKVNPDGSDELEAKFEVDVNRLWEVVPDEKKGGGILRFYPVGSDELIERELGGNRRWSLGYKTVKA